MDAYGLKLSSLPILRLTPSPDCSRNASFWTHSLVKCKPALCIQAGGGDVHRDAQGQWCQPLLLVANQCTTDCWVLLDCARLGSTEVMFWCSNSLLHAVFFGVLRMFGVHWLCVVLQPQLKVQCICRTHANLRLSCWKVKLVSIQIICIMDHHGITDASSIITMSASVLCLDHRQFGQAKSRAPALCTRRGAAWMSMLLSIYFRGVRYVSVCYGNIPPANKRSSVITTFQEEMTSIYSTNGHVVSPVSTHIFVVFAPDLKQISCFHRTVDSLHARCKIFSQKSGTLYMGFCYWKTRN